jgi:hypothetical protein
MELDKTIGASVRLTGGMWLALNAQVKLAYVVGFIEGLFQGHCFTTWDLPSLENSTAYEDASASYEGYWKRLVSDVRLRQFVCGLDLLYQDPLNRRIEVRDGLWIVMNEISGQTSGIMHAMVASFREKAASE